MWSVWLVFCDCGFHSVGPLMGKDKKLMETSWWERLTEGETGPCYDEWGNAQFSSVSQSCLFVTPWTAACQASLSITSSWSLLKLISIKSVMPTSSDKLISLKHYLLNCTLSESAVNYSIGNESCSHSQSLWSGSFHKPLILLHQRVDRMKTTITEN